MATHEVISADIWVGDTQPTTAEAEDFWLDTTKVPLFGINIIGQIPGAGPPIPGVPPVPAVPPDPAPGDAWWDGDGGLWVWDGDSWELQGYFLGPTGPSGPTGPPAFDILGSLPTGNDGPPVAGVPPVPAVPPDPDPGDAWFGADGSFWVWDGTSWVKMNTGGSALPPGGNPGDILWTDPITGDAVWGPITAHPDWILLEARVAEIERWMPTLIAWVQTADWSPDGITVITDPVPIP